MAPPALSPRGDNGCPTRMTEDKLAAYLRNLRGNRIIRPAGSRPPTSSSSSSSSTTQAPDQSQAYRFHDHDAPRSSPSSSPQRRNREPPLLYKSPFSSSSASSVSSASASSPWSSVASSPSSPTKCSISQRRGLPKWTPASPYTHPDVPDDVSTKCESQNARHRENWFYDFKEAADYDLTDHYRRLKLASGQDNDMHDHDYAHDHDHDNDGDDEEDNEEERRIQEAAQKEATELVYKHQTVGFPKINPLAPYRNPDLRGRRSRNNTDGRSADVECSSRPQYNRTSIIPTIASEDDNRFNNTYNHPTQASFTSSGQSTPDSLASMSGSRFKTHNGWRAPGQGNAPTAIAGNRKSSPFDIHEKPCSQSKNPEYTLNSVPPSPTRSTTRTTTENGSSVPTAENGLEIRSAEIRAATTMRLADRSARLPMPTGVSDRPGRPIVSFDRTWGPDREKEKDEQSNVEAGVPEIQEPVPDAAPDVPEIAVDDAENDTAEEPRMKETDETDGDSGDYRAHDAHVINITPDDTTANSFRSAPTIGEMSRFPKAPFPRPVSASSNDGRRQHHSFHTSGKLTQPSYSDDHWMTSYTRSGVPTATCDACGHGISGRVVTACNARFHPDCFSCFHCHTPLECIAFYQEPENIRLARLSSATNDEESNGASASSSLSSSSQRFYCHIDYHELFSPRCKHCKTPIESEVIIACGAEWHEGHFFCAECGDPFTQTTPFVERDGYAWCVRCHSKRTAPRCLGCKALVMEDEVATALGGAWHPRCFNCHVCGDNLGAEAGFFVKEGPPKFTPKGRQIGGPTQIAICETCERRRLLQ